MLLFVFMAGSSQRVHRNINLIYLSQFPREECGRESKSKEGRENTSEKMNIKSRAGHFYGPFVRSCVKLEKNSQSLVSI